MFYINIRSGFNQLYLAASRNKTAPNFYIRTKKKFGQNEKTNDNKATVKSSFRFKTAVFRNVTQGRFVAACFLIRANYFLQLRGMVIHEEEHSRFP
jgi:hypothetical protein